MQLKKIFLIRHAKSSWKDESLSDFERPLNKRGRANAPFMAQILKQRGIMADCILSSPALRAKDTAKFFAKMLGFSKPIVYDETLYEASKEEIHKAITAMDDACETLFVVGHNPGLNDLVKHYVGFSENIVTCGIVEIVFRCEKFKDISSQNAEFVSFEYPKKYS